MYTSKAEGKMCLKHEILITRNKNGKKVSFHHEEDRMQKMSQMYVYYVFSTILITRNKNEK